MAKFILVYDHENECYDVFPEKKYLKSGEKVEMIKESDDFESLNYEADYKNGEFQDHDDY